MCWPGALPVASGGVPTRLCTVCLPHTLHRCSSPLTLLRPVPYTHKPLPAPGPPGCSSDRVEDFCDKLRQRRIEASLDAAKGTAELMRQLVTSGKLPDPQSLLAEVKNVGLRIQAAKPIGACGPTGWPGLCAGGGGPLCWRGRDPSSLSRTLCLPVLEPKL